MLHFVLFIVCLFFLNIDLDIFHFQHLPTHFVLQFLLFPLPVIYIYFQNALFTLQVHLFEVSTEFGTELIVIG